MAREDELKKLEAKIDYYKNIELFGVGLKPEERKDLDEASKRYLGLKAYEQAERGLNENQTRPTG